MRDLANCVWSIFSGNNGSKLVAIVIVLCPGMLHNPDMKTPFRLSGLVGWMGRCGVALIALAFCASVLADPSKNVVVEPKAQVSKIQTVPSSIVAKKLYFVFTGGSAIPQPIDRISGPIPTTASPMIVYLFGVNGGE
jgi:hypothetical protein